MAGHPDLYEVYLGGEIHTVNAESGQCDCKHFQFRLISQPGATCKHGLAVRQRIEKQTACPYCTKGFVLLQIRYLGPDATPESPLLRCSICGGTGKRSSEPLPSQAKLREMFR